MFAWRNLSNANLLAAFEWLASRRDNADRDRTVNDSTTKASPPAASTSGR